MALVACKECGEQVSDTAMKCAKCGFQMRLPKRGFFGKLCLWAFIGFNLLMVLWIFGGVSANSEKMQGKQAMYRVRVGSYRILYEYSPGCVFVTSVGHRREVYRLFLF